MTIKKDSSMPTIEARFQQEEVMLFDGPVPVLFVPQTLGVYCLTSEAARALQLVREGASSEVAASTLGCATGTVRAFLERTMEILEQDRKQVNLPEPRTLKSGGSLPQLVFMVNNFCNLKCQYCYEHENVFTEPPTTLSKELAKATIEMMSDIFSKIGRIMFIGGEPALCEDLLDYICEEATANAQRKGRKIPEFCMISNGTRFTPKLSDIVSRYRVQITFSVDGPPAVHDKLRIHHDNSPSFAGIQQNIERYRQLNVAPIAIECTITSAHSAAKLSISSLLDYFGKEFGVDEAHVAVAGLPAGSSLNPGQDGEAYNLEFAEAATASVDRLLARMMGREAPGAALDLVTAMLRRLKSRDACVQMCPAGTTQLVVDSAGDIYPCWMFAGDKTYRIGNIASTNGEATLNSPVLQRILENSKSNNEDCRVCYARHLCNACLGNNRIATGAIEKMSPAFCDTIRTIAKKAVVGYAEFSRSPELREFVASGKRVENLEASGCDSLIST
jgi:uncharacterized protein